MKLTDLIPSLLLACIMIFSVILTPVYAHSKYSGFKSVGYFPTYRGYLMNKIEFSKLTHVMYAFARPDKQGNIIFYKQGSQRQLNALRKKTNKTGTKLGVAIGGWDDDYRTTRIFEDLSAQPATRTLLVRNLVQFAKEHNIDGIDMDWEHPTATSANSYTLFMTELAEALHAEELFLSVAVVSYGALGEHIHDAVLQKVDFINLMAYDSRNTDDGHHSSMQVSIDSVNYWKSRGVEPQKMVLGTPFYSRGSAVQTYSEIIEASSANACRDNANGKMYNGIPTIREKTQYALDNVGGIMNWELGQDSFTKYSLLTAIDDVINQRADTICTKN